ncbi:DNA-binding IclR family transcriptional regulator [Ancylobacter sp. 3268]|uniref:IclR family transcriptional regulator n=1 Tax=Ancylobacter sp. 3268 TaxID=2817752 RepID=UPI0028647B7B|nr:IclR family transcriptional regulator C-terminal domain-containing protein [Ancylobacter sp. 3268]MDR6950705.1 DNA-binding IclR family transcriptional regulator [Ancylobacter sp. 3268]
MSRQSHILSILQLFDTGMSVWTVEEIAKALGVSVRTAYRTVRELTQGGFLDPVSGAGYVLGPAFIRFDRVLRQSDPLIRIATPAMERVLEETSQEAVVILCRRFKDCVMSVHMVEGREPHLPASYERGAAMPLFLGAPAKVILAFLPDRVLRGLYLRNDAELRLSGIDSWANFKEQLKPVRKAGYAMTQAEIGEGRLGIAAPITREGLVVASLSLVLSVRNGRPDAERIAHFAGSVRRAASAVSAALDVSEPGAAPR